MAKQNYTPVLFLSSLWAWWLSISFFMYLMFMTEHKTLIPTFDTLSVYFLNSQDSSIWIKILIIISIIWILFFAFKHFQLLFWNLKQFFSFKKTEEYKALKSSNQEVSLMAIPLTLAMTINVIFVLWAVFIPKLWTVVEYLFPMALLAFAAVWFLALKIYLEYFSRLILKWDLDFVKNNNLTQMVAVFAFSMIWVWFAAPAAMSHTELTAVIGLIWSIFFITISIVLAILKFILWFKSIFEHWINKEAAPTLWILIPILTLIWISLIRQTHWFNHTFGSQIIAHDNFVLTTVIISLQLFFWFIWYKVMKANNYFEEFVNWDKRSPWSFALICPWVAFFVFWFFFIHIGFVKTWLVEPGSITYFLMLLPLIYIQFITIKVMFKLTKKIFW